jgi:hypothetical protein
MELSFTPGILQFFHLIVRLLLFVKSSGDSYFTGSNLVEKLNIAASHIMILRNVAEM